MKKVAIFFALFLTFGAASYAQSTKIWTLEECIAFARDNNISLAQSRLNVETANVDFFQSKTAFAPTVSGSLFGGYNFGQRLDQFNLVFVNQRTTSANLGINGSMLLFAGLQNINRLKQAKYALDANKMAVQQAENDLSLNLANAYLQLLFAYERLSITDGQISLTQNQLERTKTLYEAGAATRGELLNIEAQLTREQINKVNAENAIQQTKLSLIQLLNLPDNDLSVQKLEVEIPDDAEAMLAKSPFDVYITAAGIHPGIQSAEFSARSAEKAVSVAKGAFSPSLFLAASYGTGYSSLSQSITDTMVTITPQSPIVLPTNQGDTVVFNQPPLINVNFQRQTTPFFRQMGQNQNTQVGLSLSIPILNGLQNHASLRRAKIKLTNSRLNVDLQRQNLRTLIQTAFNDARAGFITFQSNKKNVEALTEAFQYAEEKFNAGAMNALDYSNAKTQLNNAELETLLARFEFIYRIKILEFYMGKPLKL
jgi:outer membrane protein